MNATPQQISPTFPMGELEQIEQALSAIEQWKGTLSQRRDALMQRLDVETRPAELPQPVVQMVIPRGFEYRGKHVPCWTYIDIHTSLLQRLWQDFPERREAMATAVARCGAARNYVATTRQGLFPGRSLAWAHRYSRRLVEGWYVDTNLNPERMRRILPVATAAAGLDWAQDVKVYWQWMKPGG